MDAATDNTILIPSQRLVAARVAPGDFIHHLACFAAVVHRREVERLCFKINPGI